MEEPTVKNQPNSKVDKNTKSTTDQSEDKNNPKDENENQVETVQKISQNFIYQLADRVIPTLPKEVRGPYLIIAFLALLLIPVALIQRNETYIFLICLLVLISLIGMFFYLTKMKIVRERIDLSGAEILATMEVVPKNLPSKESLEVNNLMDKLKTSISSDFNKLYTDTNEIKFRTNIFSISDVTRGSIQLKIHEQFNKDMLYEIDGNVALPPGVGSTGVCFLVREPVISIKHEKWEDKFGVTNALSKKFHPDLCWIITYPILSYKRNILAVINVDCVSFKVTGDMLKALEKHLLEIQNKTKNIKIVDEISTIFSKFQRDEIFITKRRYENS